MPQLVNFSAAQLAAEALALLLLLPTSIWCVGATAGHSSNVAAAPRRWLLQDTTDSHISTQTSTALEEPTNKSSVSWLGVLAQAGIAGQHVAAVPAAGLLPASPQGFTSIRQLYLTVNSTEPVFKAATPVAAPVTLVKVPNTNEISDQYLRNDTAIASADPEGLLNDLEAFCKSVGSWMRRCNQGISVGGKKLGTVCQVANFATGGMTKMIMEATKLCACLDKMSAAVEAAQDLFSKDSEGSLNNFKVEIIKVIGSAAACMLQNGWNIQNNKNDIINSKMLEMQRGESCGGTCTNDPRDYLGRTLTTGESWSCSVTNSGSECKCYYSYEGSDDYNVIGYSTVYNWACPAPRPWRFVSGRDIDLNVYAEIATMGAYIYYSGDFSVISQWFKDYALEFKDRAVEALKQEVTGSIMNMIAPLEVPFASLVWTFVDPNQPTLEGMNAANMQLLNKYGLEAFGDPFCAKYPILCEGRGRGGQPSFQDAFMTPLLRFYQLLNIDEYRKKLENMVSVMVDIFRLTQHVKQMVDAVAQAEKANSIGDWIGEFNAFTSLKDLKAIAELMAFFEDLPKIQKELARIQDVPSSFKGVLPEFYALAVTDPQNILTALSYVKSQAPSSEAAALATQLTEQVIAPLAKHFGGDLNVDGGVVTENPTGFVTILKVVTEAVPLKSLHGLKLKPTLQFEPFLWTWNTWFWATADYPEFSMRCWRPPIPGVGCVKIPTVKKSTKKLKVSMPNEHRPGFAFMMSLLEV